MASEPTPREHELAAQIDAELLELEKRSLTLEDHSEEIRELLAKRLAEYRVELSDVPPEVFRLGLSADGKRAEIRVGAWSALIAPAKALEMAITLQRIAAQARGNGG